MKRFLLSLVLLTVMVAVAGCKTKTREWNDRERRAVREEVRAYRDMAYLNNLAAYLKNFVFLYHGLSSCSP